MKFEELDLNDNILDALYDMNFEECTPVQEKCIPEILKGRDLLGVAQTGTGKTAAYLLPILSMLDNGDYPKDSVNCIVMSPTRELAQQIDQAMQGFAYHLNGISSVAVYGGNDGNRYDQEMKSMKLGADVVIATPGRLISHITMGNIDLSKVNFFVLDEADRMLDMGFSDDIMTIASRLPKSCQTIMFSATMPDDIENMAQKLLKNPVKVKLAVSKPAEKIKQSAYVCYTTQKIEIIKHIFKAGDLKRVIIFSGSKQKVKQINQALTQLNINCGEMHSDLDQAQRDDMMFKFKSGKIDVLVATDILSRGIDIDDIAMVINYDVPRDSEDYVHRIGRTARADRDGVAITLVNEDDMFAFHKIEQFLDKEIEKNPLPEGMKEGPDYDTSRKPRRTPAKKRRRNAREETAHKKTKQRNCSRNNNNRTENRTDNNDGEQREEKDGRNRRRNNNRKRNDNRNPNRKDDAANNGAEQSAQSGNQPNKRRRNNPKRRQNNASRNRRNDNRNFDNRRNDEQAQNKRQTKERRNASAATGNKDTGLKALIKKPLKWIKSLGKK